MSQIIELSKDLTTILSLPQFHEVIKQYEDFWFGDWAQKSPVLVQIDCWQFNHTGITKILENGHKIKWINLRTEDKIDFILYVHEEMTKHVREATARMYDKALKIVNLPKG